MSERDYSAPEYLPPSRAERARALEAEPAPAAHTRACLDRLGDLDGCAGECRRGERR